MSKIKSESLIITKEFLALPEEQRNKQWNQYFITYTNKPCGATKPTNSKPVIPKFDIIPIKTIKPPEKKQIMSKKDIDLMLANGWEMEEIKERFGEKAFDQK